MGSGLVAVGVGAEFSKGDGSVSYVELDAMGADPETHGEAEGGAEPAGRLADVWIGQHGDDGGVGYGSV